MMTTEFCYHFAVDNVTQLPNFFAFLPQMETALEQGSGTLLCVDVKGLAAINKELGKQAGDFVIASMAKVLQGPVLGEFLGRQHSAPCRRVFRTGDDEFIALFPGRSYEEVRQLGERLEREFMAQVSARGIPVRGLHISAVGYPVGGGSLAEVFVAIGEAANEQGSSWSCPDMPPWGVRVLDQMISRIKETLTLLDEAFTAAHTDAISGMPNYRAGHQFLRSVLASGKGDIESCALLFVDGDNLKCYNTLLGYEGGNEMIRLLGNVIQKSIRKGDFACRWLSGDEFVVILPRTTRREATAVAERIRLQVRLESASWPQPVTVSVGVASTETEGWDADRLLSKAIRANFQAKREGKNQVI